MTIKLCAVGGYDLVGKNMTALKFDDDVIILDIGLNLESYVEYKENKRGCDLEKNELTKIHAIPNDNIIESWKDKVKAIITGHVHLDHIGAIPYLADKYDCPIIATPFTIEVLKVTCKDEGIKLPNKYIKLCAGNIHEINENLKIEFINVTHSTPQTVLVLIHHKDKTGKVKKILYANDYKIDKTPIVEIAPDFDKLRQIGRDGIDVMISNCLYSGEDIHTPSENKAKEMLFSEFKKLDIKNRAIIITTFSSHIARLKSIIELAEKLERKIVFVGRSLTKYIECAKKAEICDFEKDGEIISSQSKVRERFRELSLNKRDYIIVCTGHQGEPNSVMWKLLHRDIKFNFQPNDIVVFSSTVIPTSYNTKLRQDIEEKLNELRIKVIKDVHVSGHLAGRDYKDILKILKPKLLIPTHGTEELAQTLMKIASNIEDVDIKTLRCHDGNKYELDEHIN
jgi:ribonuclease J